MFVPDGEYPVSCGEIRTGSPAVHGTSDIELIPDKLEPQIQGLIEQGMRIARLHVKAVALVPESIDEDIAVEQVPVPVEIKVKSIILGKFRRVFQSDTRRMNTTGCTDGMSLRRRSSHQGIPSDNFSVTAAERQINPVRGP